MNTPSALVCMTALPHHCLLCSELITISMTELLIEEFLWLQEDASEFLEEAKLKDLVAKYSEFINFPIYLYSSKEVSSLPYRLAVPPLSQFCLSCLQCHCFSRTGLSCQYAEDYSM